MITDKQIIEVLKKTKQYCETHKENNCANCKFFNYRRIIWCQIKNLVGCLYTEPKEWDMKIIEEIINEKIYNKCRLGCIICELRPIYYRLFCFVFCNSNNGIARI